MTKKLREFIEEYPKLKNITDVDDLIKALSVETKMSLAQIIAQLPEEEQQIILADADMDSLLYDWKFWGRPGQIPPEDIPWSVFAMVAGRGAGKGLELFTKILTEDGWTTMGELRRGDRVFDEQGNLCNVVVAHDPYMPDKLYRVEFSDGSHLIADGEHQWITWTHADRKSYNRRNEYKNTGGEVGLPDDWPVWRKTGRWGHKTSVGPIVRTTEDILASLRYGKRQDLNHSIPLARSLEIAESPLPIDPYIFGSWLGDGYSATGEICGNSEDIALLVEYVESQNLECGELKRASKSENCQKFRIAGMTKKLRELGVLHNKHVLMSIYIPPRTTDLHCFRDLWTLMGILIPESQWLSFVVPTNKLLNQYST